jgi:hypothetical protein
MNDITMDYVSAYKDSKRTYESLRDSNEFHDALWMLGSLRTRAKRIIASAPDGASRMNCVKDLGNYDVQEEAMRESLRNDVLGDLAQDIVDQNKKRAERSRRQEE